MEIISQNYEKILESLIINKFSEHVNIKTNPNDNKVFNYIKMLDTLDERICEIALTSLKTIFETIDRGYRNSRERLHSYHIKAKTTRSIMTIFGEITYKKTIYTHKRLGGTFCYIDDYLGLKKYDYFDPYLKALVIEYSASNPYTKTAKIINDMIGNRIKIDKHYQYLSKQTVRNIVLNSPLSKPIHQELNTPEDLYIMADEKFVHTQNNDNKDVMVKQIVVFDGKEKKNSRVKLLNKKIFSSFINNPSSDCLDYLFYVYDMDKIKNIYVMGDGASWIKKLIYEFKVNNKTKVSFNLDKFHFKQAIHHLAQNENIEWILSYYVRSNMKSDFLSVCESLKQQFPYRLETITDKQQYIINNWSFINNLYNNNLSCPMESQISHNLADLFSSRPKAYSLSSLNKLILIRNHFKNGFNLKLLFLNNFNKKEILTVGQKPLDWSIFDRQDIPLDQSILPIHYYQNNNYDSSYKSLYFSWISKF